MRKILVIISALFFYIANAQTFSLITDPIEGDESFFHNNALVEIGILEDQLIVTGQHFCKPKPGTNVSSACASLSSFDFQGENIHSILIDTFFNTDQGGLLVDNGRIFLASFKHDDSSVGRNLIVQEFEKSLTLKDQFIIPANPNSVMNIDGIKRVEDNYYVYGDAVYQGCSKGVIQKLDLDFKLLWSKEYIHGASQNGCDKLQKADHNNLIYKHKFNKGQTGTAGNSGLQIVKINSDGTKVDSLELDVSTYASNALLSDSEDMIYVHTPAHPTSSSIFDVSQGSLNKYSNDLDTLIWSLRLPFNNYIDGRTYLITNINEARNGDILICGTVFDRELFGIFLERQSHVNSSYIARVTKDGEISWLRLYKSPNINPNLPIEEFGRFHNSVLANLTELEDGRIIAGGSSALNIAQSNEIIGSTEALSHFMILAVDGETGCIEGEECDEVIILDKQYRPRDNYLEIINPEYKWTILETDEYGITQKRRYTYQVDSIDYDTLPDGTIFQVGMFDVSSIFTKRIDLATANNATPTVQGEYRELGGRLFKRVGNTVNENLIFDIHLQAGERIEVYREDSIKELVAITTDSVMLDDGLTRKRILLHCTSSPNDTIVWIEGIGELDNSKGCGFEGAKTRIQCVQEKSGDTVYSLNGEDCQESPNTCTSNSFSVGDTWTYTNFNAAGGIGPKTFEIVDEVEWQGRQALVVRPGVLDSEDYMVQEDGRIYFWDDMIQEYQLNYDFNNDSLYHVRFYNPTLDRVDTITVTVDSVKTNEVDGQNIEVQSISGDRFGYLEIYKGIGPNSLAPRIPFNSADVGFGSLRCFDSSECDVNFLGMPCDTLITGVSTDDLKMNLDIDVYPNPTSDRLFVDSSLQNWSYRVTNLQSQQVAEGTYEKSIDVSVLPPGIYFLQLEDDDNLYRAIRFVKQ